MWETRERLNRSSKGIFALAREKAEKERDYRIAKRQAILKLRSEGLPATLILDLAMGEVADIKFQRDIAEERYNSARDSMRNTQTEASLLQTISKTQSEM